ncbi:hypothetical protein LTR86_006716 [Recurvomyces mirabilis]|nr:hypothetical protein LTR86_006716 [Recurvomyces mirabilis]
MAGSSEAPDTPSTQSTFPSPTATRSHSVAELRRKYDPQYASSEASSAMSDEQSPELPSRSMQAPSVSDVEEDDEEPGIAPTASSEVSFQSRERSVSRSSRGSRSSRRSVSQWSQQDDARRQHMAHASQPYPHHYINPVYGQHRSSSSSSTHSAQHGYHMAMQHYQWPLPPAPPPHPATVNGHLESMEPPHAPDAPDLNQRTIVGYERLALELATQDSTVKPLYRKFEYLNHRILLHLQDELAELEEHLRTLDEIIAQMEPSSPLEKTRTPASRRAETYKGTEIHLQRTNLLGRIFIKTEQYNRAMTAYTNLTKTSSQAEKEQVEAYTTWLKTHNPVHDSETRFLSHTVDLIAPSTPLPQSSTSAISLTPGALAAYIPIALMLPLLLFALIPSLAGRLAVTALTAAGAFLVVGRTRIRGLLPPREWAVCGAVYALVMAAVAGCVPVYGA